MENVNVAGRDVGADLIQGRDDLLGLGGRQQADPAEHARMRLAGANIVRKQTAVVADRLGEGVTRVSVSPLNRPPQVL